MTEVLPLNNIGLKGISTDPLPWSLPPEFITDGRNFRIFAGAIKNARGSALWSTSGATFNIGHLMRVMSISGNFWLALGRSAAYVFDGTTWTDISSLAGYAGLGVDDELLWSGCMLGQIPVVNNPQAAPEYWSPQSVSQVLQPLPFDAVDNWAAKGYSAKIMRSHKTFLFALNLSESGVDFPDSYRWSHPADINGLPATWDETNDAFLAGKASLGGEGGEIIDGLSLRDAFCIYSEKGVDVLDSTNDEFVWRRRELSSTFGLLAKDAIVEIKGQHLFLSSGDIVKNDGNKLDSVVHNRISSHLAARIDSDNYARSFAVKNDLLKEAWFCIPETGESYPTLAYVYNWKDDSWTIKDLPSNISFAAQGSYSSTADTWDALSASELWSTQSHIWDSGGASPANNTVVGADISDDSLHFLDPSMTPDNDLDFYIERSNFPLLGHRQVTTITRVYPHIEGEGSLSIQFGSQDWRNGLIDFN